MPSTLESHFLSVAQFMETSHEEECLLVFHFLSVAQFLETSTKESVSWSATFCQLPSLWKRQRRTVSLGLPLSVSCPVYGNVNEGQCLLVSDFLSVAQFMETSHEGECLLVCHFLSVAQFMETSTKESASLWYRSQRDVHIPVKSYVFSVSLTDFRQFSSLTAYCKDLTYFREKMTKYESL